MGLDVELLALIVRGDDTAFKLSGLVKDVRSLEVSLSEGIHAGLLRGVSSQERGLL